jgi:ABC-2 type transport system ATP-binding protein
MNVSETETVGCVAAEDGQASAAIAVENVSKIYPGRGWFGLRRPTGEVARPALQNVSFTIREGEMVGLLGPNGAGKTTLLKSIATLLQVTSGQIIVHGLDVEADPMRARRLMGLVTCEERSFYWRLSARQNLRFFAALYGVPEKQSGPRIDMLLETLGLSAAANLPYHTYSTGMRQKLAIARGLLSDPAVILYDEPTRSLDPLSAQNIRRWIVANRAGARKTTHLIATNQLHEAEQLCDRVLILNRGAVIADGAIAQIREQFRAGGKLTHRVTYRGCSLNDRLRDVPGIVLITETEEAGEPGVTTIRMMAEEDGQAFSGVLAEILRSGGTVLRCETEQMPFDEVFCALVEKDHAVSQRDRS